jgi:pimeloyl-ACP methyl ester carboxylesterase
MTTGLRQTPIEPVTRDVAARGARIRFVEAGQGAPLLLVHDYLSNHLEWEDVLLALAERFHVIVPDLPGFGDSEKPPPSRYAYGCEAFSESLVDLVASLGLGRVAVCGHALGGSIALTMAAQHPHVVDKLLLVAPIVQPRRSDPFTRVATVPLLGPVLFKQLYGRAIFRSYVRDRHFGKVASVPWARIDYLFDLFNGPAAREAAYATMRGTLDTRPLMASVPRVTAPALVAWGRGDRANPVEQGRRLARELRGARFEVFDCGPSPAEECPREFVKAVTTFLAGRKGG